MFILDSLEIKEEGFYFLYLFKEIAVTQSFLELDKKITNCETHEEHKMCQNNNDDVQEEIQKYCGCKLFSVDMNDQV